MARTLGLRPLLDTGFELALATSGDEELCSAILESLLAPVKAIRLAPMPVIIGPTVPPQQQKTKC